MEGIKSGRVEKILSSLIFVWLGVEKWRDEKMCLYKFIHIPLLLNDALLKKKRQKKKSITQIY